MVRWEKFSRAREGNCVKYNTMNNDEIILSLCARLKETRLSLSMTQQQLADRAQVGIATIKRIEKGEG